MAMRSGGSFLGRDPEDCTAELTKSDNLFQKPWLLAGRDMGEVVMPNAEGTVKKIALSVSTLAFYHYIDGADKAISQE